MEQTKSPFAVAEVQVSYTPHYKASERPKISNSKDIHEILKASWDEGKMQLLEEFKMILLNRANRVLGLFTVSQGGQAGTVADPKVIFSIALKGNACSVILAHNHPSGSLKPSQADLSLTQKLVGAGHLLDIAVLDHLILTSEDYFSFADQGLM